ncbi:MAG: nucleoside kinase [Pygmaiobacter massiliensis]|nr:nucleoside kinase [Pygmaiobacter massiliensis]
MPAIWIPKRLVDIGLVNTAAQNPENFVRHCEIEYESRVRAAAREILESGCRVVMLTGPSASGKTTTAHKLAGRIRDLGSYSQVVSLDNFYKNKEEYPRLPDGTKDYENVTALDIPMIQKCLGEIIHKGYTSLPEFDFQTESRRKQLKELVLGDGVVVVEGIHALNPMLTDSLPREEIYKVYAGLREEYSLKGQRAISTRDLRLARRLVRDYKFRSHSPEKTITMWKAVCEGEDRFIKVFKPEADLLLDTSFSYEICAMAPFVREAYEALDPKSSAYARMGELMLSFASCRPISVDLIPHNSMLQEFLGSGEPV